MKMNNFKKITYLRPGDAVAGGGKNDPPFVVLV